MAKNSSFLKPTKIIIASSSKSWKNYSLEIHFIQYGCHVRNATNFTIDSTNAVDAKRRHFFPTPIVILKDFFNVLRIKITLFRCFKKGLTFKITKLFLVQIASAQNKIY